MKRSQWILAGTAGALSIAVLSAGAMSMASALQVRDASGAPVAGAEIRGVAVSAVDAAIGKAGQADGIVAPTPTSTPTATTPAAASVPEPEPAQAPAPADSAPSPVSIASPVSAASND
ncbi:hypothetical protein [Agrococcus carbonis]|nr:hypothetical protein [Agrococcus carbonis]